MYFNLYCKFYIFLGRNGNKKYRQRPNDYEVEEWRDAGKFKLYKTPLYFIEMEEMNI